MIYTLSKCEDKVIDSTNLAINEINANISHKDFIPLLKSKEWDLYLLYFNHYRIPNAYIGDTFTKQLFIYLKILVNENTLIKSAMTISNQSEIRLPFVHKF